MKRNNMLSKRYFLGSLILIISFSACKDDKKKEVEPEASKEIIAVKEPFFKLSLAQWSLHKTLFDGKMDPYDFAEKAKSMGFSGVEYVNQFYAKELEADNYSEAAMAKFVERCNAEAKEHGVQNVLIMVDGEGYMAVSDAAERQKTVENHYKWVDAAAAMGCHAIRVNLYGEDDPVKWKANSVDALTKLATYAKDKNINILVENHGGLSSNGAMHVDVMATVNMDNCGTLPDLGNFCIRRNDPKDWASGCAEMYDIYKGVEELMPHAKAVSAKSHDFDAAGNETEIDYVRMLQTVKDAGYTGFIGVEYEGSELGEEEGIIATRDLLIKASKEIN